MRGPGVLSGCPGPFPERSGYAGNGKKYAGSVSGVKFSPGSGASLVVDGGMTRNIDAGICAMDLLCFCIFAGNNRGE
ncbi:MAG: hypothetical protein PWP72_1328 [Thermoanaerobacter sp.]|jgi:hypothetical protein|nr:hypothetical protein [Thermoanaerobacter sp.]